MNTETKETKLPENIESIKINFETAEKLIYRSNYRRTRSYKFTLNDTIKNLNISEG